MTVVYDLIQRGFTYTPRRLWATTHQQSREMTSVHNLQLNFRCKDMWLGQRDCKSAVNHVARFKLSSGRSGCDKAERRVIETFREVSRFMVQSRLTWWHEFAAY
jgi:hypothetical protein